MAKGKKAKIKSKIRSRPKKKPAPVTCCEISEAEADKLFKELASQKHIPFDYPDDCCYSRAHEMSRLMKDKGIESEKVWNYGSGFPTGAPLRVDTPNHPSGHVNWRYHVAPVVKVRGKDGVLRDMVMDPSISDRPVTVKEWVDKQQDPAATHEITDKKYYFRTPGNAYTQEDPAYSETKSKLAEHSLNRDLRKAGAP